MKKQSIILFFILYSLTFVGNVFSREILGSDQLVYNSLAEKLTTEQVQEVIRINNLWGWIYYLILPLLLYLKILFIATIITMGTLFIEQKIKFSQIFNIVLKAEFIFLIPIVLKTGWFYFFKKDYTLEDLQNYMPLSLESIFGYQNFEKWFLYPLQTINLFEVAYWIILTFLLAKAIPTTKTKSLTLVASTYGVGMVIWTAAIMFLTLNMS